MRWSQLYGNAEHPPRPFLSSFLFQTLPFVAPHNWTMSEKHVSKRECLKSRRSRVILALIILLVICAAVIPPVVVTQTRKKSSSMGPKSKVFVPLYVYPAPGAWTPLEEVYVSPFPSSPDLPPMLCPPFPISQLPGVPPHNTASP